MAAVTQTIAAVPIETQQFQGRRDENTIFPRARVIFRQFSTVTAKIAGNTNQLTITFTLPVNFAYSLAEWHVSIGSATSLDSDNYDNLGTGIFQFITGATTDLQVQLIAAGDTPETSSGMQKHFVISAASRFLEIFFNTAGIAPNLTCLFNDTDGTNNTDQLGASIYASFLQYDIRQVENNVVNAPQPVSVRN